MKARKKKRDRRDSLAPHCYKDAMFFEPGSDICDTCPFFYPCGVYAGHDWGNVNRKSVETAMAQRRVPNRDAIHAITSIFGVTNNAASLSYSRRRKKTRP